MCVLPQRKRRTSQGCVSCRYRFSFYRSLATFGRELDSPFTLVINLVRLVFLPREMSIRPQFRNGRAASG